jgi:hypothetical protein
LLTAEVRQFKRRDCERSAPYEGSNCAGALALVWVIGIYSVITGVIFGALAFRLKKHA